MFRWCQQDGECHTKGSVYNPCTDCLPSGNNSCDVAHCPTKMACAAPPGYDPNLSFKLFQYAALAYSDFPENCKQVNDASNGLQVIAKVATLCDLFHDCFAYLAVDRNANAIVLAYRGPANVEAAIGALETIVLSSEPVHIGGRVNHYFKKGFDKLWPEVLKHLQILLNQMPGAKILITGHSFGGALASLASTEIAFIKLVRK